MRPTGEDARVYARVFARGETSDGVRASLASLEREPYMYGRFFSMRAGEERREGGTREGAARTGRTGPRGIIRVDDDKHLSVPSDCL